MRIAWGSGKNSSVISKTVICKSTTIVPSGRSIKPFVIGRKNWLFDNTANVANASAVLYSLIETAKANGLTPFDYLKILMEELPKNPADIDRLLPWNVEIPRQAET